MKNAAAYDRLINEGGEGYSTYDSMPEHSPSQKKSYSWKGEAKTLFGMESIVEGLERRLEGCIDRGDTWLVPEREAEIALAKAELNK